MKSTSIRFLVFMLVSFHAKTQDSLFSLKTYIPPNYTYSELNIVPNINQSYTEADGIKRTRVGFSPYLTYLHTMQNDKNTRLIKTIFQPRFDYNKLNGVRPSNQNGDKLNIDLDLENDYYYTKRWHILSNLLFDYSTDKPLNQARENFVEISTALGIGFGRPQDILGAWKAMILIDDLEKAEIPVQRYKMKELADQIYLLRRRRFKDFRLGNIYQLSSLYNYLLENHIEELTPKNAAIINDSYTYEGNRLRKNGFKLSLEVSPIIRSNYTKIATVSSNSLSFIAKASSFSPINKFLQFNNFGVISYGNHYANNIFFGFKDLSYKRFELSYVNSLGWYPSARTNLFINSRSVYRSNKLESSIKSNTYILELSSDLEYYFSRNLIANFNFFVNFNSSEFFKSSININQGLSLSFNFILL